jgi:Flp pilus assembly protein TadD
LAKLKRTRLQQCDEGVGLYERAEAIRPTFDGAFGLGTCFAVLEDDERAIAHFRIALQRDPKAAVAWEGLGTALARSGRVAEGIEALERAVAIAPRMSEAYYSLGQAYRKSGNEERSRVAFEKARELQASDRQ